MLFDLSDLSCAEDADLSAALSAITAELRRRIFTDDGFASKVHALHPTAVAVLCEVVWDDYPTASPEGVLLADGTVHRADPLAASVQWAEICDDVASLAAVDGAITEDVNHGHLIRLDPPRPSVSGVPPKT